MERSFLLSDENSTPRKQEGAGGFSDWDGWRTTATASRDFRTQLISKHLIFIWHFRTFRMRHVIPSHVISELEHVIPSHVISEWNMWSHHMWFQKWTCDPITCDYSSVIWRHGIPVAFIQREPESVGLRFQNITCDFSCNWCNADYSFYRVVFVHL